MGKKVQRPKIKWLQKRGKIYQWTQAAPNKVEEGGVILSLVFLLVCFRDEGFTGY